MTVQTDKPGVLCIGHRGAAGHAPENTLASIERGIALGADYVEIDVQLTADDHLVIMHDKRVDRTTNGHGYLSEMSLRELRTLDAGLGQTIPLLEEVLGAASGRSGMMIEIITPGIAGRVVEMVQQTRFEGPVLYASFLHAELLAVRNRQPSARTLALFEGIPVGGVDFLLNARPTHVGLAFDSVTPEFVSKLQSNGLTVFTYTVNDLRDFERALKVGVNGIISDYPERLAMVAKDGA
jgi:glycerophosphoryl diester phosphodiesterase